MGTVQAVVPVVVRRSGKTIKQIERPLWQVQGGYAVKYKGRLWSLNDGHIDTGGSPLDIDTKKTPVGPSSKKETSKPTGDHIQDDSEIRRQIVEAPASWRLLVEAGPGTGKTEIAARRLTNLIRNELSPGQILVLSFSRSAVRTLTKRLGKIGEDDPRVIEDLRHLSIRTFDSWAFRMLRTLGESPQTLLRRSHDENIAALTKLASGSRREDVRAMMGDRRHIIVDEFQDLPGVRGDLVLALLSLVAPPGAEPDRGFTILGDPAQAIYGWASGTREDGAPFPSPQEYWREVCHRYSDELQQKTLIRNYRSQPPLAHLSSKLRGVLMSNRPENEKILCMLEAVASLKSTVEPLGPELLNGATSGSRAILTRTNGEALRVLQKLFGKDAEAPSTPIQLRAGNHAGLPPAWIGALLRRLRSSSLPQSQFVRIHSHLAKTWGEDGCTRLGLPEVDAAWARIARASGAAEDASSIDIAELRSRLEWPDAFPDDQPLTDDGFIVTTVHQSKGMEFDVVTLLDTSPEADPSSNFNEGKDSNSVETANVNYVAITRAAQQIDRAARDNIYPPPLHRKFANGSRRRLFNWHHGWINMEIGLRGDIDPLGFVDPELLGGADGVEDLQSFLLAEAASLAGRKVMLCKHYMDEKAEWHIHIQDGKEPGRLIGRTSNQLSIDLLSVLHKAGYQLPWKIFNLRISSVGTVTAQSETSLAEPERTSGLWLGVSLFGTGDFQTWKGKKS